MSPPHLLVNKLGWPRSCSNYRETSNVEPAIHRQPTAAATFQASAQSPRANPLSILLPSATMAESPRLPPRLTTRATRFSGTRHQFAPFIPSLPAPPTTDHPRHPRPPLPSILASPIRIPRRLRRPRLRPCPGPRTRAPGDDAAVGPRVVLRLVVPAQFARRCRGRRHGARAGRCRGRVVTRQLAVEARLVGCCCGGWWGAPRRARERGPRREFHAL
ncbi:hypothetical protein F4780DRAFT_761307 [Xylariomycetidae sp. FL0641]|nr:hypothetical protein F4780DRAFT_761307 [Xylariomycetidae sp. FL0641]